MNANQSSCVETATHDGADNTQKQKNQIEMTHRDHGPQHKNDSINLIIETESCDKSVLYSHTTESRDCILHKTAVAPVGYYKTFINTHILFAEGAQRSFVTENLAKKLNLKTIGTEILSTFGGGDKTT